MALVGQNHGLFGAAARHADEHRAVGMLLIPDNAIDDLSHPRVRNTYNKASEDQSLTEVRRSNSGFLGRPGAVTQCRVGHLSR